LQGGAWLGGVHSMWGKEICHPLLRVCSLYLFKH